MHWVSDDINHKSTLVDGRHLHEELYNSLRLRSKNYRWDPRFQAGIWDGWECFFDKINGTCLTGMVSVIQAMGYDIPEIVQAVDPLAKYDFDFDFQLKIPGKDEELLLNSYQGTSLEHVVNGKRRGLFDHITAAGKLATYTAVIRTILGSPDEKRPMRATVVVPTLGLLTQTVQAMTEMLGEEIGAYGGKHKLLTPRIVVVHDLRLKSCLKGSEEERLAFGTDILVVDEAQTITSKLRPFLRKCGNAYYRYAFSGSFFDHDQARAFHTLGFFGWTISTVGDEETLEAGRTVPPDFYFYEYPLQVSVALKDELGYGETYFEFLVTNDGYNKYFANLIIPEYNLGKTILVLVKRVEHCDRFSALLNSLGAEAVVYNGQVSHETRQDLKADFKSGKLPILIATEQTLGVGEDIPRINVLMNLGCGLSKGATKQKFGRALRSSDGKESVKVIEPFVTGVNWFARHSRSRMNLAKEYYKTGRCFWTPIGGQTVLMK